MERSYYASSQHQHHASYSSLSSALTKTGPQASSRTTLGDLTNNGVQQHVTSAKSASLGSHKPLQAAPFRATLPHEAFVDPRLIDGVRFADVIDVSKKQRRQDWIDVDAQNHDDPQAVSHYAQAIFEYLKQAERTKRPIHNYLEFQPDINIKMRSILVDWLVEVAEEYKLCADTLFLAVNFLDRFLSVHRVQRVHLQLAGITCMWLAAKFEEIYPPNVSEFAYITDNTYTREQLVEMEEEVLKKLRYELAVPTAKTFLRRMLQVCSPDDHLHYLSNYLTEICLIEYRMMEFMPSEIAAAAVYLSNLILRRQPWSPTLQHYSFFAPCDILRCVEEVHRVHQEVTERAMVGELTAMYDKYSHGKYLQVARHTPLSQEAFSSHMRMLSNAASSDRASGASHGVIRTS